METNKCHINGKSLSLLHEAEFKEFEPQLKFETRLKYCCFHFKLQLNVSGFKPALN